MDLLPPGLSVAWRTLRRDVWNAVVNIETSRLILRRPLLADVTRLFEFLGDTKAMQYTHVDGTLRQCRRRIAVHERRRRRDGFAPWTILSKLEDRIIGWGGLYEHPFHPGWVLKSVTSSIRHIGVTDTRPNWLSPARSWRTRV
jgi:RimJ/RimL family protein N-acetyltransferase